MVWICLENNALEEKEIDWSTDFLNIFDKLLTLAMNTKITEKKMLVINVEVVAKNNLITIQTNGNNFSIIESEVIKKNKMEWVAEENKIRWKIKLKKFGLIEWDNDINSLIKKRCIDVAALSKDILMFFNNTKIKINNFKNFVELHTESETKDGSTNIVFEKALTANGMCEIAVVHSNKGPKEIVFVNCLDTINEQTRELVDNITKTLIEHSSKNANSPKVLPFQVKCYMWIFINLLWTSDKQNELIQISNSFFQNVEKLGIMESAISWCLKNNDLTEIVNEPQIFDENSALEDDMCQQDNRTLIQNKIKYIPSAIGRLKVGERKIMFTCLKINSNKIGINELAGTVIAQTTYRSDQTSLYKTIIDSIHDFTGSNIKLLQTNEQYAEMSQLIRLIYRPEDNILLKYQYKSIKDILKAFYNVRLDYYAKRKAYLEVIIAAEIDKLDNQIRFISHMCEKKTFSLKEDLIADLICNDYRPDFVLQWKNTFSPNET